MRLILIASILFSASASLAADELPTTRPTPKTMDPKLLYAAGVAFGERVRQGLERDGYEYDAAMVMEGVKDGLAGAGRKYPQEELDEAINKVERLVQTRRAERRYAEDPRFKELADANKKRSAEGLEQRLHWSGAEVLPSGIQVEVIEDAGGAIAATGKYIDVSFEVRLIDGTLVDESPADGPVRMPLWKLTPALQDAIALMPLGATWRLAIPPEHAFGLAGKPPLIGPNEAVVIKVTLVGVE